MSKLLSYLIPGIAVAALLVIINETLVPASLHNADWFNTLMAILSLVCIITPCIIYFVKTPPGRGAQP